VRWVKKKEWGERRQGRGDLEGRGHEVISEKDITLPSPIDGRQGRGWGRSQGWVFPIMEEGELWPGPY